MGVVACAAGKKLISASELMRKGKQQNLYRGEAKSWWLEADLGGKGYLHKFFRQFRGNLCTLMGQHKISFTNQRVWLCVLKTEVCVRACLPYTSRALVGFK